jgi:hypothetical protein
MNTPDILFKHLRVVVTNETAFVALLNKYPKITQDLISGRDNQDCECNSRVSKFLIEEYESNNESKEFLDKVVLSDEIIQAATIWENREKDFRQKTFDFYGKVYKVGLSGEDWLNFFKFRY